MMTFASMLALFSAMVVLAALPSVSVLVVSMRSAMLGFLHGAVTTLGIVVGDVLFILVALWGLSFLTEVLGSSASLISYLGGAYLIGLGIGLWRSQSKQADIEVRGKASWMSSFLAGLLITLADQKAMLFYLGFFPAFLDISSVSYQETIVLLAIAIVAVGGVKLIYALLANQSKLLMHSSIRHSLNVLAGGVTIGVGVFLILRAALT
ncbi:LysE family translocator [Leptolyngbya sp. AN02str]|uniref:LysE family translocator n=1 Tax=Leptolyngbya sp. AN02str TaxID=3423363 RepID=UPI003D31B3AD